jgi:hypothetical protein
LKSSHAGYLMLGIFRNPDSVIGHQLLDEEVKLDHYLTGVRGLGAGWGSWARAIVKRGGGNLAAAS